MKVSRWLVVVLALAVGFLILVKLRWPYNCFFTLLCLAAVIVAIWPIIPSFQKTQTKTRTASNGEEKIMRFITKRKANVIVYALLYIPLLVLVVGSIMVGNFVVFVLAISLAFVGGYFLGSPLIRALADVGWWFVRVPENHAAFIERDGACCLVIMNVNDHKYRNHFQALSGKRNREGGRRYVLLPERRGLYFIGFNAWPWVYKLKNPWYENSGDAVNPLIEPMRFQPLMERAWNLLSEKKGGEVPNVGTHDPVDVYTSLFVRIRVWDPYKSAYSAVHTAESVRFSIISRLRGVVADLFYFDPSAKGDDELEINPEIQQLAHRSLVKDIGLCVAFKVETETGNESEEELLKSRKLRRVEPSVEDEDTDVIDIPDALELNSDIPLNFKKHSIAWVILTVYGYLLLDVEITDIEPEETVYKQLQEKTTAKARGAAALAEARGTARAIVKRAEGDRDAIKLRSDAIKTAEGRLILISDVSEKISQKVGNIVFAGGSGDVAKITTVVKEILGQYASNSTSRSATEEASSTDAS